jgi:hypothetical protein
MNKLGKIFPVENFNRSMIYRGSNNTNKNAAGNMTVTVPAGTIKNDLMVVCLMSKTAALSTYSPTWTTAIYASGWNSGNGKMRVMFKKALATEPGTYTFSGNAVVLVTLRYVDVFSSNSKTAAAGVNTLTTDQIPGTFKLSFFGSLYTNNIALTTTGEISDIVTVNSNSAKLAYGSSLHVSNLTVQRSTTSNVMLCCTVGLV